MRPFSCARPPLLTYRSRFRTGYAHIQVQVLADGFEFEGKFYDSLSAVARAITGSHCNGYSFFKLGQMAEGPCTVISDHEGIVRIAQQGRAPQHLKPVWDELYAATSRKDTQFEWRRRDQTLGQRLAHQLARDAAKWR